MYGEFLQTLSPKHRQNMQLLDNVLALRRLDRGNSDLMLNLSDAIEHCNPTQLYNLYSWLSDQDKDTFVWVAASVLSVESFRNVVRYTVEKQIIENEARHMVKESLDLLQQQTAQLRKEEDQLAEERAKLKSEKVWTKRDLLNLSSQIEKLAVTL